MLGLRERGGGWAAGFLVPLGAPRPPHTSLEAERAELGDRGRCGEMQGWVQGSRRGGRGRAARGVGSLSRVGARWGDPACLAPRFGDILGRRRRRRRRRTEESGRLCPSRIFLRSGLAVHNSIAGSPYPKKHSRRAHSSRRWPAIAEAYTFPKRLGRAFPIPGPVFHGRIHPFLPVLPALAEALVTRLSSARVPHPQLLIDFVSPGELEQAMCVCFRRSGKKLKYNKSLQKLCLPPNPRPPPQ